MAELKPASRIEPWAHTEGSNKEILSQHGRRCGGEPMRSLTVGMLVIVAITSILGTVSAQPNTWRITPGKCYGPICLGATKDDVRARAGSPQIIPGVPSTVLDNLWSYAGFAVGFSETDGRVDFLGIEDRTAVANGGVRVGSTIDQVVDVYGDSFYKHGQRCLDTSVTTGAMWTLHFDYLDKGIGFQFSVGASPRVREIEVFPPRACPVQLRRRAL
jgi:hypothetical protein